jgi:hypothetical protein
MADHTGGAHCFLSAIAFELPVRPHTVAVTLIQIIRSGRVWGSSTLTL